MNFLDKILHQAQIKEASLEKDVKLEQKIQAILQRISQMVRDFPKGRIEYNPTYKTLEVVVGDLTFVLCDENSFYTKTMRDIHRNVAGFVPYNDKFAIYGVKIDYDGKNNKVYLNYNGLEDDLRHEMVHYFDFKRSGKKRVKKYVAKLEGGSNTLNVNDENYNKYANDAYEMNAHFIEYVMPIVNQYIQKTKILPLHFEDFKKEILVKFSKYNYYNNLTEKNKKRLLKRLAIYYQELKTFVIKHEEVDLHKETKSLGLEKIDFSDVFRDLKNVFINLFSKNKKVA